MTAARPDEMVGGMSIPAARPTDLFAFAEIARRHGDFALAGVAMAARRSGARMASLRLAFFGVAERPLAAPEIAGVLAETSCAPEGVAAAVALARRLECVGSAHVPAALKRHLAGVVLQRAASTLARRLDAAT